MLVKLAERKDAAVFTLLEQAAARLHDVALGPGGETAPATGPGGEVETAPATEAVVEAEADGSSGFTQFAITDHEVGAATAPWL